MLPETLLAWLADASIVQRAKLAALHERHLATIRAYHDDDYVRLVREIKKRLSSPKLAPEVAALVAALDDRRPANPRPDPPAKPPRPAPIVIAPPPANATDDDIGAHLQAAIAADPDTRDNYIVFGDWLASRGDPRGQLVTIGQALAKHPQDKTMRAAHTRHLAEHGDVILGTLASCEDLVREIEWHMGFIKKCRVASTFARFNGELPHARIADVIGWLVDDPGPARFLQDLTVGIVRHDDNSYEDVCAVLARRLRPALRRLYLGDFESEECELNWSRIGDISSLWATVPNLRELVLRSGSMTLGPMVLPKLESLSTITGGLDAPAVAHLAGSEWPALGTLSLMIGPGSEGACTDPGQLMPILSGAHVPKLTALGIVNCDFTDEVCRILATSDLTPRLAELDLSMGTMSDDGARVIAAHRERFAHLRLSIGQNFLTPEGEAILASVTTVVASGDQRDDGGDPASRYAAMYE